MELRQLNQAQKQAIEYNDGPLLIVAGAGTGKTTVITEKVAYLVEKGLTKPNEIVALTFTDKAAREMEDRISERLDTQYTEIFIGTFHTFCQRILEDYGLEIGLPNRFKLVTETDAWLMMREKIYDLGLDYYRPLGNPTRHIHELLDHFSKCKDELIRPEQYIEYAESVRLDSDGALNQESNRLKEVANAYHYYNQLLLEQNALDFGDLIFYSVELLQKRSNILQKLHKKYKYILVDEFQDVNFAQYNLVQLLSQKTFLTVVGDDDQSIYAFRGASISNILHFKEDFPHSKEIVLQENYRSQQQILDIAYTSIQNNNPERLEVKLNIDKHLVSRIEKENAEVVFIPAASIDEEVKKVVEKILDLKENDSNATWDDFALLVRANSHADPFLRGLQNANIPYEFLASVGLFKQPLVMDCINFLKAVENFYDASALFRIMRMICFNMADADIQKVTFLAKKKSLSFFEILEHAGEYHISPDGVQIAYKIISLLQEAVSLNRTLSPSKVIYHFLQKSGCLEYLSVKEQEGDVDILHQIYQLRQFFDILARYEEIHPDAHVASFLEQYNYMVESGDEGKLYQPVDTPDSVNVLTVHAAKGLEFKYVFIVNIVEERFPTRRRGGGIEIPDALVKETIPQGDYHLQEERRLFYVAVTRAKKGLYFTAAKSYGGVREKKISRFLSEIGYSFDQINKGEKLFDVLSPPLKGERSFSKSTSDIVPSTFSFSQIKSYETCPYQYKLAHVLKIPTKSNASFSFGQTIHRTLEKFYSLLQERNAQTQASLFDVTTPQKTDGLAVPTLTELLQLYQDNWIPDWYKDKKQREEYYEKGKEILKVFYSSQEGKWTVPLALEAPFKIKIGNESIQGRIDRIDQLDDGSLHILDYKTGTPKEKVEGDDKDQLLVYQIVAESLPQWRNVGPIGKLTFYYLNNNTQVSFVAGNKDLEKLKEKIDTTISRIKQKEFDATPNQVICRNCDFRDICEYRSL